MALAPFSDDPENARPHFRRLYHLFAALPDAMRQTLSMGMTGDFEVAIEEGANLHPNWNRHFWAEKIEAGVGCRVSGVGKYARLTRSLYKFSSERTHFPTPDTRHPTP